MIKALTIVCCIQTIALIIGAYLFYKMVMDLTAKLMAKDLHEVKAYHGKPEKERPVNQYPKSDELLALECELEDKKAIQALAEDIKATGDEMLIKAMGV